MDRLTAAPPAPRLLKKLAIAGGARAALFRVAVLGGRGAAVWALPATGLFMSVLYPMINSTGISCFPKPSHGAVAGLLLFFTCLSAVLAPLAMAALADAWGDTTYSIGVGAMFATLLLALCGWNLARRPFAGRLAERDRADYADAGVEQTGAVG